MNHTTHVGPDGQPGTVANPWELAAAADFVGGASGPDGKLDLVWHNPSTGAVFVWQMNNMVHVGPDPSLPGKVSPWHIGAVIDFDGNHIPDIVWRNTQSGQTTIVRFQKTAQGIVPLGSEATVGTVAPPWELGGAADYSRDGQPDLLWHNPVSGEIYIWPMTGTTHVGPDPYISGALAPYHVGTTADFTGDRNPDIAWFNATTGQVFIWPMTGYTHVGPDPQPGTAAGYDVVGP